MDFQNIIFIVGEAGTAKTTRLMNLAIDLIKKGKTIICLAFTHSAVNNMFQTFSTLNGVEPEKKLFRTIHSYFRIVPDEGIKSFNMKRKDPDYILIDEFSLIPLEIIELIFKSCSKKLILAGDLLQLNPISEKRGIPQIELFNNAKFISKETDFYSSLLVANHLSNNVFSTEQYQKCDKVLLTQNYRSENHVMKILQDVLNNQIEILHFKDQGLKEYVQKNNPTFIASRYEWLTLMYKEFTDSSQYDKSLNTKLGQTFYNNDKKFILTKNVSKTIFNGDVVKIVSEGVFQHGPEQFKLEKEDDQYPILPIDYISVHKSQGRGYDYVVIILDQLFEITMLYTAITRARKDVKFVLINYDIDRFMFELRKMNKAFNLLKTIIYEKQD